MDDAAILLGFLVNELFNGVLKRSAKQPRPETCSELGVCDSFGYPSSHSQCIWYFLIVTLLVRSPSSCCTCCFGTHAPLQRRL